MTLLVQVGQNKNYCTVREYGFVSTSCSNHMHLFYLIFYTLNSKQEPQQRLRGSTLQFGFGFFSEAPLFPAGIKWIFVS